MLQTARQRYKSFFIRPSCNLTYCDKVQKIILQFDLYAKKKGAIIPAGGDAESMVAGIIAPWAIGIVLAPCGGQEVRRLVA